MTKATVSAASESALLELDVELTDLSAIVEAAREAGCVVQTARLHFESDGIDDLCSVARLERLLGAIAGVRRVSVGLAAGSVTIDYDPAVTSFAAIGQELRQCEIDFTPALSRIPIPKWRQGSPLLATLAAIGATLILVFTSGHSDALAHSGAVGFKLLEPFTLLQNLRSFAIGGSQLEPSASLALLLAALLTTFWAARPLFRSAHRSLTGPVANRDLPVAAGLVAGLVAAVSATAWTRDLQPVPLQILISVIWCGATITIGRSLDRRRLRRVRAADTASDLRPRSRPIAGFGGITPEKRADSAAQFALAFTLPTAVLVTAVYFTVAPAGSVTASVLLLAALTLIVTPRTLGLSASVVVGRALQRARLDGAWFRNAAALEKLGQIKTLVLNRSGSLVGGDLAITDFVLLDGADQGELLRLAAAVEATSDHPVAQAILARARNAGPLASVEDLEVSNAGGISARVGQRLVRIGKPSYIEKHGTSIGPIQDELDRFWSEGKTAVGISADRKLVGAIALAAPRREASLEAVRRLEALGIDVVMLSGDSIPAAQAFATAGGIARSIGDVGQREKGSAVSRVTRQDGLVAACGGVVRDASSLARADLSITIQPGATRPLADLTLTRADLNGLPDAIELSRAAVRIARRNVRFAISFNILAFSAVLALSFSPWAIIVSPLSALLTSMTAGLIVRSAGGSRFRLRRAP